MSSPENELQSSCLFEGMISFRSVVNGIRSGVSDRKVLKVLFDREKVYSLSRHLSYIKAMSYEMGFELALCPKEEIEALALGKTHAGIITVCTERHLPPLSECADSENKIGFYMMLDGIEDPFNLGYALRSLYAAGVSGVILPPKSRMNVSGVVCRASAGASEMTPVFEATPENAFEFFKNAGYKVVCAADQENSKSIWSADLAYPVFMIVGGEKRGISSRILAGADLIVRIDYGREFSASLSSASAAAILSFEILRQNTNIKPF